MPILEVSELAKSYGSVVGVDGLTLSVEEGEIFGFLGPNGAGKTTTIRLVMRLLHPDRGSISLFGVPLRGRAASVRQRIGYLPGEFRPYVEMTGVRFLDYMARFRARAPKLRSDLLDRLEFAAATLERPIKHLSHGNRQKLGIVQALEHEPDLAILDEPTLGLDPLMQEAFYNIVGMLRDRGKCVFLSSHVLSEVEKVCERVAIIRDGSLVALESIEALRHKCRRDSWRSTENGANIASTVTFYRFSRR
jgi:ABC-2 type transport system ATP-binding protein